MHKKIIGILVCMLLIVTIIPVSGDLKEISFSNDKGNDVNPVSNADKWMKIFGGKADEYGSCVQQTSDGGFIVFGITESYGAGREDFWLIKTDSNGNKIWDKTYGGEEADWASFGCQTNDGGYIVVGRTYSFDVSKSDIWLIKIDDVGNIIWNKTFGGTGFETPFEVLQTNDGGYVVFGYTDSFGAGNRDMWLIKTDSDGNIEWDKKYGGIQDDQGHSIKQTIDGGYILAGGTFTSQTTNKFDIWLIKVDTDGEIVWDKTYGGSQHETAWSVQQTTDSGYIVCGEIDVGGLDEYNIWLLKTDSNGELLWEKVFGGFNYDRGWSVQQTSDGGYVITGDTFAGPRVDGLLIKTDSNGKEEWRKTYGGYNTDITIHVQQTSDGGYILTGYCQPRRFQLRDLWLIKTDEYGNAPYSFYNCFERSMFKLRIFEFFPILFPLFQRLFQRLGLQ
jgi:hypothetical protein